LFELEFVAGHSDLQTNYNENSVIICCTFTNVYTDKFDVVQGALYINSGTNFLIFNNEEVTFSLLNKFVVYMYAKYTQGIVPLTGVLKLKDMHPFKFWHHRGEIKFVHI